MMGIVDDEFDIDMAKDKDEKEAAELAKASKLWRTLRLTSRSKLFEFEKIEDGKKTRLLFENPPEDTKEVSSEDATKPSENPSQSKEEHTNLPETQQQEAQANIGVAS